nr:glycosyltransferase family 2 protein [Desulfobulbaceae bacterium]
MQPKVYVLVLNYNGKQHLEYCLPSMAATQYDNCHIVLVDNGSTDGSLEFTRENFKDVIILENGANLVWAGGNNAGIKYALENGADYIVLQNNDTKADPRWIAGAVEVCENDPRIGIVGFTMLQEYIKGEDPDEIRFKELSAAWEKLEYEDAPHVTGAAFFSRADVYRDLGLIDEAYFAYGEEDDMARRIKRAGYLQVRINVPLWHYNGGYWSKRLWKSSWFAMRNTIRLIIKNESYSAGWQEIKEVIRFVCKPGVEFDPNIPHCLRMRPSNFMVNSLALGCAFLWNIFALPATLSARREDERRIDLVRKRWA